MNGIVFPYYYGIDKLTGINKEGFGERLLDLQGFVCVSSRCAVGQSLVVGVIIARFLVSEMTKGMMRFLVILRLVGISVTLGLKGKFMISGGMLVSGGTVGVERRGVQGATSREVCVGM